MKKISHLPITEDAADMYIDGIKPDGLDGEGNPKYKNYRVPASAISGEVWEDITSEFSMETSAYYVVALKNYSSELNHINKKLRVTVNTFNKGFDDNATITGTIQTPVFSTNDESYINLSFSVAYDGTLPDEGYLIGFLSLPNALDFRIVIGFGTEINYPVPEGFDTPTITKIEMLVE